MNSAVLSPHISSLFAPEVVAAELRTPGDPALLLPAEAVYLGRAVAKRAQEFAAGRLCARRALSEFGIVDFPIQAAPDRSPVWPPSMVGSITHTAGIGAAAVARRGQVKALGLDIEVVGDVKAEIWPSICLTAEVAWLNSIPVIEQAAAAALIFSAKEAFYKCQYPLVQERLDFHEARIEALEWGVSRGQFQVHATSSFAVTAHTTMPLRGQYLFQDGFVMTGISLSAA